MNASFDFKFGKFKIPKSLVIYSSKHFFIMFPPNPKLKNHLMIISKREVPNLSEMTNEEVFDYSLTLQFIMKKIEGFSNAHSSCVIIDEGEDIGQMIKHFHAHVIPRVKNDIPNDNEIYNRMVTFDEEFVKEYSELLTNEKNKGELKLMVDQFKEYILKLN